MAKTHQIHTKHVLFLSKNLFVKPVFENDKRKENIYMYTHIYYTLHIQYHNKKKKKKTICLLSR